MNKITISGERGHQFEGQGKGHMKGFERKKEEGEMMWLYYLKNKIENKIIDFHI